MCFFPFFLCVFFFSQVPDTSQILTRTSAQLTSTEYIYTANKCIDNDENNYCQGGNLGDTLTINLDDYYMVTKIVTLYIYTYINQWIVDI